MDNTLKVEHLKKTYGKRNVVKDISFEMQARSLGCWAQMELARPLHST